MSALLHPLKVQVPGRRRENTMDPVIHEVRTRRCLRPTPSLHRNGAWHLPLPLSHVLPQALRAGVLPRERTSCHAVRVCDALAMDLTYQRLYTNSSSSILCCI